MRNWRDLRIGLLPVVLLAVVFSAVGFARSAQAQFANDIINTDNGTKIGSITFPATAGTTATGVEFDLLGFTEADITGISWALGVDNLVMTLSLHAFTGDAVCNQSGAPCSNSELWATATTVDRTKYSCTATRCLGGVFSTILIEFAQAAPAYACAGFEPPLADGPVTVKKNRVLPLKAELADGDGYVLGDGDLTAPPVVQVIYDSGMGGGCGRRQRVRAVDRPGHGRQPLRVHRLRVAVQPQDQEL